MSPVKDYEYAPVPHLTTEQRREYLKKALDMRKRRAALKTLMKCGRIGVSEALEAEPAQGMTAYNFLCSLPGVGPKHAFRAMERIGINPNRRVRGLGCRQRSKIVEVFGDVD